MPKIMTRKLCRTAAAIPFIALALLLSACALFEPTEEEIAQAEDDLSTCLGFHLDIGEPLSGCYDMYFEVVEPDVPQSEIDAALIAFDECYANLDLLIDCRAKMLTDLGFGPPEPEEPLEPEVDAGQEVVPEPEQPVAPVVEAQPEPEQAVEPLTATVILTWDERTDLDLAAVPFVAALPDDPAPQMSWDSAPDGALVADDTVCPDVSGMEQILLTEPGRYDISVGVWSGCIINDEQLPHFASYTIEIRYSDGAVSEVTGVIEGQVWQTVTEVSIP